MNDLLVYVMFGGVSIFILFLFLYVLKVEKYIEHKFNSFEPNFEEYNNDIFAVKKKCEELETEIKKLKEFVHKYEEIKKDLSRLAFQIKDSQLTKLSNITRQEEEKILSLYKSGSSIEDISKELNIPTGEIELILKFAGF